MDLEHLGAMLNKQSDMKILLMVFLCSLGTLKQIYGVRSGPYKTSVTRVGPCPTPSVPLDPSPASHYQTALYNTTTETNLLQGNITVLRDHTIKKVRAKSYSWEGNKWKVKSQISNMGCNSVYFPALAQTLGLKYDAQTCTFMKGSYHFSNLSLNKLQHQWMSSQEYGKVLWRFEVFSSAGSVFCYEYETLIEPSK